MHFSWVYALASSSLALASSSYQDTSPFVLVSTAPIPAQNSDQLQLSADVLRATQSFLASCPTKRYLVLSQPHVHSEELVHPSSSPSLARLLRGGDDPQTKALSSFSVSGVYGEIDASEVVRSVKAACGPDVAIGELSLEPLGPKDRQATLLKNDKILAQAVKLVQQDDSYTIVYVSTPGEPIFDDPAPLFGLGSAAGDGQLRKRADGDGDGATANERPSLLERYEFVNAGIFMTVLASLILLAIVAVGLSALTSLKVSVGAFDKDMGPNAAQKKQS